jgi:NhaA family Na+:H+ antiporter
MATASSDHPSATLGLRGRGRRVEARVGHAAEPVRGRADVRGGRLPRLWHFATEYLLLLPLGAVIALAWANTAPDSYFRTAFSLQFVVNDLLMALFFGLMMKEVVEATAAGGVLHPWRRAALPLVAAGGLTVVPALVFAGLVPWPDEPRLIEGWPAVFATDLALGYFVARVIFGRHPAIPFFILLAVGANAFGVVALALTTPDSQLRPAVIGLLMPAALGFAGLLRRMQVRSLWPYIVVAGGLSWCALYFGGFAPALALVPVVPFLPHARRDPGFFVDADPSARDALSRFELWSRHPAQVALVLFGLVNAGVPLRALYLASTLTLPIATLVGKPIGLLAGAGLALALGLHLPHRIGWRELVVVGLISSVGFTVALFFAAVALGPGPVLSALRMGALVSVAGGLAAIGTARLLGVGRFAR